jgi:DNA ligase-associated metallophosphoesterase
MSLPLDFAGETLWLLPEGAVWWPARHTLFVADLHLGKGAAFRAQGQPVPAGSSRATLARLRQLVDAHGVQQLVVLGDFWHGRQGLVVPLLRAVADFCTRVPTTLVLGNHDRPIHPHELPLRIAEQPLVIGPLVAAHEPPATGATAPAAFTLAGHWHPAVSLRSRAGDRLRRACFVHYPQLLVLPAFGGLTGAMSLDLRTLARTQGRAAVLAEGSVTWLATPR